VAEVADSVQNGPGPKAATSPSGFTTGSRNPRLFPATAFYGQFILGYENHGIVPPTRRGRGDQGSAIPTTESHHGRPSAIWA
jgi:hypothetical protein